MKVLIIDDDDGLLDFFRSHLPAYGFVVDIARNGTKGLALARVNEYDIIVLDINLPDMTGEDVCHELGVEGTVKATILMLTAVADIDTKVRLLDAGADDFLTKPFSFDEFVARLRALVRRSGKAVHEVLSVDDIVLDVGKQTVMRGNKELSLTRKEFVLLEYLMRHQGMVVSKGALIEHGWNSLANSFSNAIETHMANLRRKLGEPSLIQTIHSRGYKMG